MNVKSFLPITVGLENVLLCHLVVVLWMTQQCILLQPPNKHFTFNSVAVAVRTILALEGWYVMWKAAAVDGRALLHEEVWRRHRWGHERGFWLCWKKPEPLATDVEACRADEGAPMSGRTWTGCNRPSYWRSWRGARGWWAAPRLQREVVWAKKSSEMSNKYSRSVSGVVNTGMSWDHKTIRINTWRGGVFVLWSWSASAKQVTGIWKKEIQFSTTTFQDLP